MPNTPFCLLHPTLRFACYKHDAAAMAETRSAFPTTQTAAIHSAAVCGRCPSTPRTLATMRLRPRPRLRARAKDRSMDPKPFSLRCDPEKYSTSLWPPIMCNHSCIRQELACYRNAAASPLYAVCPLSLTNYGVQQSRNSCASLSSLDTKLVPCFHGRLQLPLARRRTTNCVRVGSIARLALTGEALLLSPLMGISVSSCNEVYMTHHRYSLCYVPAVLTCVCACFTAISCMVSVALRWLLRLRRTSLAWSQPYILRIPSRGSAKLLLT